MPNFRRRLLIALAIAALFFGLAMLHPYPRQSLFGPTIRGKPWCVWEAEVRRYVHGDDYETTWAAKLLRSIGVEHQRIGPRKLFDDAEMIPLVVELLDDADPAVRSKVLEAITRFAAIRDESALPALRRRMSDSVAGSRIRAAMAAWMIAKDKEVIAPLLREMIDENNTEEDRERAAGFFLWSDVCEQSPDVFGELARRAGAKDQPVRRCLMEAMPKFGLKCVPVLRQGLADPDLYVRRQAAIGLGRFGVNDPAVIPILVEMLTTCTGRGDFADAAQALGGLQTNASAAIPVLTKLRNHSDVAVRDAVAAALAAIDPGKEQ